MALLLIKVVWNVMVCQFVHGYRNFRQAQCLHFQGQTEKEQWTSWSEALCSSNTSVTNTHQHDRTS